MLSRSPRARKAGCGSYGYYRRRFSDKVVRGALKLHKAVLGLLP